MLVIFKTPSEQEVNEAVDKCEAFFAANPRRKVARVGLWDGQTHKIHKNYISQDIQFWKK